MNYNGQISAIKFFVSSSILRGTQREIIYDDDDGNG